MFDGFEIDKHIDIIAVAALVLSIVNSIGAVTAAIYGWHKRSRFLRVEAEFRYKVPYGLYTSSPLRASVYLYIATIEKPLTLTKLEVWYWSSRLWYLSGIRGKEKAPIAYRLIHNIPPFLEVGKHAQTEISQQQRDGIPEIPEKGILEIRVYHSLSKKPVKAVVQK